MAWPSIGSTSSLVTVPQPQSTDRLRPIVVVGLEREMVGMVVRSRGPSDHGGLWRGTAVPGLVSGPLVFWRRRCPGAPPRPLSSGDEHDGAAAPPATPHQHRAPPAVPRPWRTAPAAARAPTGNEPGRSPTSTAASPGRCRPPTPDRRSTATARPHRSPPSATPSRSRSTPSPGPATPDAAARSARTRRSPHPPAPAGTSVSAPPPTPDPTTVAPTQAWSIQHEYTTKLHPCDPN